MRPLRTRTLAPAFLGLPVLLAAGSVPAPGVQAPAPVDQLAWMAGCWSRTSASSSTDELWTRPRGGVMLGLSVTVRDGRAVEWEHVLLHERDGALRFRASPSGQATAEFTASHVSDTLAVFENPEHDFPQRVLYRKAAGDSLHARIEGPGDEGTTRGIDFRYGRGSCPS